MASCQFSEDQYEDQLICELYKQKAINGIHFKPSRQLEKTLGYDFAFWSDLLLPIIHNSFVIHPPGLTTPTTPHGRYVNTFIQAKIPKIIRRKTKRNLHKFNAHKGWPYYEFAIETEQCNTLARLESNIGQLGVVRYVSPCFHTRADIEAYHAQTRVIQTSYFVAPTLLLNHAHFTYRKPSVAGIAFSDPARIAKSINLIREVKAAMAQTKPRLFWEMIDDLHSRLTEIPSFRNAALFEPYALLTDIESEIIRNRLGFPEQLRKLYSIGVWCKSNRILWSIIHAQ